MTTRQTSREAFALLVKSGKVRGNQHDVLERLIRLGQATSGEVIETICGADNVNAWRARFTELQARGLIQEIGVRPCKISGRKSIVWEFTGRMKPLNVKRGHRVDGAAWKTLALEAITALEHGWSAQTQRKLRERAEALS